ncbi:MIP family channel protein [Agrobacterium tumefaciens]|uniref:MIP family channel protein n=1 Tax=Agrobacterium tumefaciens TaxID=358 RepID=A0A2L2LKX0_AGRTU|nr:MIP/aquaporin family protein [Agrobacterium tumefaciens]AVH44981.1 MIP family channel protein [Agrobacterium tumefaciens]
MIRGLLVPIYPSVKRAHLENKPEATPTTRAFERIALARKKLLGNSNVVYLPHSPIAVGTQSRSVQHHIPKTEIITVNPSLLKRLVAEFLGTALLTVSVVGSAVMASAMTDVPALVMLCVAISCSAALFVLLELLGPISGGHFNPAVSLAMLLEREIPRNEAVAYMCMQTIGALLGVVFVHITFGLPLLSVGIHVRTGFPVWIAEAVSTFGLIFTVLLGNRFRPNSVSAFVGVYVLSLTLFASSSFANPATTIARAFTDSLAGIRPVDVLAFVFSQCLGSWLAVGLARWLTSPAGATADRR